MTKKYIWATEDIYPSIESWEKEYASVLSETDFSRYKNTLNTEEGFLSCMKAIEKIERKIEKLSVYATMLHDTDTTDSVYDGLVSKITALAVDFSSQVSFITPELTALSEKKLNSYINSPALKEYDYTLKCLKNEKEHVLSENEEKLLAESGNALSSFREIFTKIDNADLPLKKIKHEGKSIPLSHGVYSVLLHGTDRKLREKAYKSYYRTYLSLINVISATYSGSVKKDVFLSKVKKYESSLSCALKKEDVPEIVYHNLISSVHQALPVLHEYINEKKKALKLDKMYMYDMYAPITENPGLSLDYEKAYELVKEGLSPLGKEYAELLCKAHDERWIDVYEKKGKRSGAYSISVFDTHPFVLLNYQPTTHDVFTIAHELGHAMHSYFSSKNQPYAKADYRIFVAEVASTVNEVLLIYHLLEKEQDKGLKKYLLTYLLEMIRTTLFRQTQFAEFEAYSHGEIEKGNPLTKDGMCKKYAEINKEYYGNAIESDDYIKYEWARIPHFYRAFYVYKYATGIISALAIVNRIKTEGQKAVDDYFAFLSSGGSNGPVELLKIAGVDLTTKKPFEQALKVFEDTLKKYESID